MKVGILVANAIFTDNEVGAAMSARMKEQGAKETVVRPAAQGEGALAFQLAAMADDEGFEMILTCGGSGLLENVPEATRRAIGKELPGFGEAMRMRGLEHTERSLLSRGIAGVRGRTLIINLPGRPGAAGEALDAVAGAVPHALEMIKLGRECPRPPVDGDM